MSIRYFAFILVLPLVLLSCSSNEPADVAIKYVKMLDEGNYDEIVDHVYGCDSANTAYRNHIVTIYQQMMVTQQKEHGHIKSLEVVNSDIHDAEDYANVVLHEVFDDETERDILITLVKSGDNWQLK